jgi:hypothetical protein
MKENRGRVKQWQLGERGLYETNGERSGDLMVVWEKERVDDTIGVEYKTIMH